MFRIDPEKNPRVKKKLQNLLGSKADLSKLAVFEARANDTLTISGAGGFLKGSRMTKNYLTQMQDAVQMGNYVPIIKLHNQNNSLPEGRIFDAQLFNNDEKEGETDLHILFFLQNDSSLTSKVETGIIAEMSTGTTPKSLCCSVCNYDFLASDENRRRLYAGRGYTPLCSEGHQWGVNGNHLLLSGVSKWKETSIVTRGAVDRAKILNQEQLKLANVTDEINLSDHNNGDNIPLVTLNQDDLSFEIGLGSLINTPKNHGNKDMTDVTLKSDEYKVLLGQEAKVNVLEADLKAEKDKTDALAKDLKTAQDEADRLKDVETKLSDAEQKVADLETQKTELETKLAAATTGSGNRGKGLGEDGEEQGEKAEFSLDPSYFTVR